MRGELCRQPGGRSLLVSGNAVASYDGKTVDIRRLNNIAVCYRV